MRTAIRQLTQVFVSGVVFDHVGGSLNRCYCLKSGLIEDAPLGFRGAVFQALKDKIGLLRENWF